MRLIKITKLNPIRDENQVIYKWEPAGYALLNPHNIAAVSYVEELGKTLVILTNGKEQIVDETRETMARLFNEATS